MRKAQSGFTLVEIAIVLVIIGLLLGGVLKGQELITQAKIKNIANDFNGVMAAVYAYQDRYRALPGDDKNAATRWSGTTSGGGDGLVADSGTVTNETLLFWQHLRAAGLIAGGATDSSPPINAANGKTIVYTGALKLGGLSVCSDLLPGKIAGAIDSQMDDGDPSKGQVRAMEGNTAANLPNQTGSTAYKDDGSTLYTVCKAL